MWEACLPSWMLLFPLSSPLCPSLYHSPESCLDSANRVPWQELKGRRWGRSMTPSVPVHPHACKIAKSHCSSKEGNSLSDPLPVNSLLSQTRNVLDTMKLWKRRPGLQITKLWVIRCRSPQEELCSSHLHTQQLECESRTPKESLDGISQDPPLMPYKSISLCNYLGVVPPGSRQALCQQKTQKSKVSGMN